MVIGKETEDMILGLSPVPIGSLDLDGGRLASLKVHTRYYGQVFARRVIADGVPASRAWSVIKAKLKDFMGESPWWSDLDPYTQEVIWESYRAGVAPEAEGIA
jgi:hypothetical protein